MRHQDQTKRPRVEQFYTECKNVAPATGSPVLNAVPRVRKLEPHPHTKRGLDQTLDNMELTRDLTRDTNRSGQSPSGNGNSVLWVYYWSGYWWGGDHILF